MFHSGKIQRNGRRHLFGAAAIAIPALSLAGCGTAAEEDDVRESITIAWPVSTNWNPGAALTNELAPGAVYDTLWHFDGLQGVLDGEFDPWLAESFEMADDRRKVAVKLREDVDFVDGEHLNAAGVEKQFDILMSTEGAIQNYLRTAFGTEFTATGEYTLEITTTSAIERGWLFVISATPIVSPVAMDNPAVFEDGPVGSGPYLVDEVVGDSEISFVRNPDYWNPDVYAYDRVTLKSFADDIAKLNALKTGQIDVASLSIPSALEAEASGFALYEAQEGFAHLLVLDHKGVIQPALGDVRVRRALNMAFDRDSILEEINHGHGRASSQPFIEDQPEYVEGGDDIYRYDPEGAKALLAEAGYPDGFDVTILSYSGDSSSEPIVRQSLADIGIEVTFEPVGPDLAEFFAAHSSGDYPIVLSGQPFGAVVGGVAQWGGVEGTEAEAILERINTGTWADWEAASQELGQFLLDQAWYVPFSHPNVMYASDPDIAVWVASTAGFVGESRPQLRDYYPAEWGSRPE